MYTVNAYCDWEGLEFSLDYKGEGKWSDDESLEDHLFDDLEEAKAFCHDSRDEFYPGSFIRVTSLEEINGAWVFRELYDVEGSKSDDH